MSPGPVQPVAYWDEVATRTWGRYITEAERQTIDAAQAAAPHPRQALDVGCGGGRWTRLLLDRGWSVTGLDVDTEALAVYAERNPEARGIAVPTSNRELPAADGSVSLVISIEVLPVVHSDWFVAEAQRVLVPGGRLVTVVWNRWSLRGMVTDAGSRLRRQGPHDFYRASYRAWRRDLQTAGFEVTAERGLCWFPFGRVSNSPLVPISVAVERGLRLDRLPLLSPWVLVTATRLADGRPSPPPPDAETPSDREGRRGRPASVA